MSHRAAVGYRDGMEASHQTLAVLLTLAGLIAATLEYSTMIARRSLRHGRSVVDPATLEASGLTALVRVFIVAES